VGGAAAKDGNARRWGQRAEQVGESVKKIYQLGFYAVSRHFAKYLAGSTLQCLKDYANRGFRGV
jgi:hypothetical protein